MDLESISKSYFSNLNALAEKIASDIGNTREAYQDLWHTLSKKEQNQTIDESIISPSAVLKYSNLPLQSLEQNQNAYSWFTRSQLNLDFGDQVMTSGANMFCRSDADQCLKLTPTEKEEPQSDLTDRSSNKTKNPGSLKTADDKPVTKSLKSSVLKPKNPPPPPPKVTTSTTHNENTSDNTKDENETKSNSNDIPKTGFDFLDNW